MLLFSPSYQNEQHQVEGKYTIRKLGDHSRNKNVPIWFLLFWLGTCLRHYQLESSAFLISCFSNILFTNCSANIVSPLPLLAISCQILQEVLQQSLAPSCIKVGGMAILFQTTHKMQHLVKLLKLHPLPLLYGQYICNWAIIFCMQVCRLSTSSLGVAPMCTVASWSCHALKVTTTFLSEVASSNMRAYEISPSVSSSDKKVVVVLRADW